jgi:two-component sensor histidine kinase
MDLPLTLASSASVRNQLVQLDIVDRLGRLVPPLVAQLLFATLCSVSALVARSVIDMVTPGAGPFGMIMPFVLVATLFGRWQSGLATHVFLVGYAWYYILPVVGSFAFANPAEGPRIAVNVLAGLAIVALGELFRRSVRAAVEDREMLIREIDHRVANNFASILSMLRLQRSRIDNPAVRDALDTASGRVESYARAHQSLYRDGTSDERVDMPSYLGDLCAALESVLAEVSGADIRCWADDIALPRDQAVTLGLIVNEVATNSAKHAFGESREGLIRVKLDHRDSQIVLSVSDNGSGMTQTERPGGLGMSLITALAKQAGAEVERESSAAGTSFRFVMDY